MEPSSCRYFVIQFNVDDNLEAMPLHLAPLYGTVETVNLTQADIQQHLVELPQVSSEDVERVLKNIIILDDHHQQQSHHQQSHHHSPHHRQQLYQQRQHHIHYHIYSLVLDANVTGILLRNTSRTLRLRILVINKENERILQDVRYVEWKAVCSLSILFLFVFLFILKRMLVFIII